MITGLGIDLVDISRIEELILKWKRKVIDKVFTKEEFLYCSKHNKPYQHYASTFAVKEALIKAYGKGKLSLKEIEVIRQASGRPVVNLYGNTKDIIDSAGVDNIHVTITHDAGYSIAVVILEKNN